MANHNQNLTQWKVEDPSNTNKVKVKTFGKQPSMDLTKLSTKNIPSDAEVATRIEHFLQNFTCQYSSSGPLLVSFLGSLDHALNNSLYEPTIARPLILYLHHSRSIAVNIFCQNVLCTDTITDYLADEFLIWMWDRTLETDHTILLKMLIRYTTKHVATTVASYSIDAYPLLICLSVHENRIDIVSVIEGTMSGTETLTQLLETRKKFDRRAELPHSQLVQKYAITNTNQSTTSDILTAVTDNSSTTEIIREAFKKSYMQITRIDQVENNKWLTEYLEEKKIIDTRVGHDQNEKILFHGCPRSAAEQIIQGGFDHQLIGRHGTAYGHGFYFSSDHNISHCYSIPDDIRGDGRTMLVCRVLVGQTCIGNRGMIDCPLGYDSTTNGSTIFVVYSNRQILPEHIITYKKDYNIDV